MGNIESLNLPEDLDLLPIHPRVLAKMRVRGINEGHVEEALYDDPDMVAIPVKRGRRKAPIGTRPILLWIEWSSL